MRPAAVLAFLLAAAGAGVQANAAAKAAPAVEPFEYTIAPSLTARRYLTGKGRQLSVRVSSTATVPGRVGGARISVDARVGPDAIEVTARRLEKPVGSRGRRPGNVPARWFQFSVTRLNFPPARTVKLHIRFKGAVEQFELAYRRGPGLVLTPVKTEFAKLDKPAFPIKGFSQASARAGDVTYLVSSLSAAALKRRKPLWQRALPFASAPKSVKVVGRTLLVRTAGKDCYYIGRADGEAIYHHPGPLAGKAPLDEIVAAAKNAYASGRGKRAAMKKYIRALAALEDRRGAPLLIECIEKGFGISEKAMAAAALERINGNRAAWTRVYRQGGDLYTAKMYRRVRNPAARAKETARWEVVFGKIGTPILVPGRARPGKPK